MAKVSYTYTHALARSTEASRPPPAIIIVTHHQPYGCHHVAPSCTLTHPHTQPHASPLGLVKENEIIYGIMKAYLHRDEAANFLATHYVHNQKDYECKNCRRLNRASTCPCGWDLRCAVRVLIQFRTKEESAWSFGVHEEKGRDSGHLPLLDPRGSTCTGGHSRTHAAVCPCLPSLRAPYPRFLALALVFF